MQRTTIMLVFGGESSEHSVSISSARNVFAALDNTKYEVVLAYIDATGKWWLMESLSDSIDVTYGLQLLPMLGEGGFTTSADDQRIMPDVILPILHGNNGEDGTVQGLARLLHIPIVGCGVASSAVCMDKILTKQLLEHGGIMTVPYETHAIGEARPSFGFLQERLGGVLFVKPARSGSSVGVSRVENDEELSVALTLAHRHDNKVLIERAIVARELEIGMLGSGIDLRLSGVGEIHPEGSFYSFESKYDASSQSSVTIPADIPADLSGRIQSIAKKAYGLVDGSGLARIDFFLADDGQLYLNEINTLPGFTNISMYPKLWRHEGLSYSDVIEQLLTMTIKNGIVR